MQTQQHDMSVNNKVEYSKFVNDDEFVNILEHPDIRAELPKYAEWPTFPQLWINGELVGGCDIVLEMYQSGELKPMVEAASPEASE